MTVDGNPRLTALEQRVASLEQALVRLFTSTPLAPPVPTPVMTSTLPALIIEPPDPSWVGILHTNERDREIYPDWPRPCGQVALYLTQRPQQHEKASWEPMRVLVAGESKWRQPTLHDEPRCAACGSLIDPFSSTDLDYLAVMAPSEPPPPAPQKASRRRRKSGEPPSHYPGRFSPGRSEEGGPLPIPGVSRELGQIDLDALQRLSGQVYADGTG